MELHNTNDRVNVRIIAQPYLPQFISDRYKYFDTKLKSYLNDILYSSSKLRAAKKCYFIFDTDNEKKIYWIRINSLKLNELHYPDVNDIVVHITQSENIKFIQKIKRGELYDYNEKELTLSIIENINQGKIYASYKQVTGKELGTGQSKTIKNFLELEQLFKYKSLGNRNDVLNFSQLINSQEIYVPHAKQFNDVFDTNIKEEWLSKEEWKLLNKKYLSIPSKRLKSATIREYIFNLNKCNKILCLSKINPLCSSANSQWAHYSDEYNGYVIEYNLEELFYLFSLQIPPIATSSDITIDEDNCNNYYNHEIHFRKVTYKDNFNPYKNLWELLKREAKYNNSYEEYFSTKSKIWEHEQEYRFIFRNLIEYSNYIEKVSDGFFAEDQNIQEAKCYFYVPRPQKIYIGYKVNSHTKELILKECKEKNIKVCCLQRFNYKKGLWDTD